MAQTFEFFKKEFEFKGKHADMASELCCLNDYEHTYFKRLIDVYILAPIIGFRLNRKAEVDYSTTSTRSIFGEQMNKEKETLDFIMQMILLLENAEQDTSEKCVDRAFRGVDSQEKYDEYYKLFHDYVRGGVEELYERLVVRKPEMDEELYDDKTANLYALMERFCL